MMPPSYEMTEEQKCSFANQQLSSAQTLTTICIVGAFVSLIIGGVPLALVTLVCGGVGASKVKSAIAVLGEKDGVSARLLRQATIGMVVSIVSVILNAIALAIIMPAMMQYLQTGDISVLTNALSASAPASSSASTSVWD